MSVICDPLGDALTVSEAQFTVFGNRPSPEADNEMMLTTAKVERAAWLTV